jgi:hypothetical protein
MNNLASTYRKQGRCDDAEKLEVQVIETAMTKLGADHPNCEAFVGRSQRMNIACLAFTWKAQYRSAEAIDLHFPRVL